MPRCYRPVMNLLSRRRGRKPGALDSPGGRPSRRTGSSPGWAPCNRRSPGAACWRAPRCARARDRAPRAGVPAFPAERHRVVTGIHGSPSREPMFLVRTVSGELRSGHLIQGGREDHHERYRIPSFRREQEPAGRRDRARAPAAPGRARHHGHLGRHHGQHRPGDELLLRVRVPRHHRGGRLATDDRGGRHRDRPARQHAGPVLPGAAVDRRLHHVRRQVLRWHQRGHHRLTLRGRLHHRDVVGHRDLRRLPVHHPAALRARGHPVGLPDRDPHRAGRADDDPRRGAVHQDRRVLLRVRDAGARRRLGRVPDQERRPPVRRPVRAQPHHQRLLRPRGRVPAGHLPVHRLGELGRPGRGDRQPAPQRAPRGVHLGGDHGRQLHRVRLRHGQRGSATT